jgi:hypothetical protein
MAGSSATSASTLALMGSLGLERFGRKQVIKMSVTEEADLTKEQAKELSEHIWNDEDKRDFVLAISAPSRAARRD